MTSPLHREHTVDFSTEPLGPGWLRRRPTEPETREAVLDGLCRTGPRHILLRELLKALDDAQEVVLLSSFLLAEDSLARAMLNAAQRRVRVYVLTASEQRIGKVVREDDGLAQDMAEHHKRLLETLAGKVLLRSAEHIHAKFLVADPQSPTRARGWLSTANFNKALTDGIELGVRLEGDEARALAACFHWGFWCEAERELRGPNRLLEIQRNHPAIPARPASHTILATHRGGTSLRDQVAALIQAAREEILVASYGLDADHPSVRALGEAARSGVRVTLLTRPRGPAVAAAVAALAEAGAAVVAHDRLHAKALVVDGRALVMSANLEAHGLDEGFEVGALLSGDLARGVEETLREWAATFPWVYRADAMRGEHLGDFCPLKERVRDGVVRVTESHAQRAPQVVAPDAAALSDVPAPTLSPTPPRGELPHRVTFSWDVVPPTLPKGAVERLREVERDASGQGGKSRSRVPHEPRLFEHGGRRYVLLEGDSDVERARAAAQAHGATVVVR